MIVRADFNQLIDSQKTINAFHVETETSKIVPIENAKFWAGKCLSSLYRINAIQGIHIFDLRKAITIEVHFDGKIVGAFTQKRVPNNLFKKGSPEAFKMKNSIYILVPTDFRPPYKQLPLNQATNFQSARYLDTIRYLDKEFLKNSTQILYTGMTN